MNLYIPDFAGFGLHFTLDGFRLIYLVILTFMWATSLMFSPEYMLHHDNKKRYYLFTALTYFATVGVFLSANLMTTFLFFEIMSFTSYVWVAQEETKPALRAAETYLAVAILGGMVLLMGLFLLYHAAGTLEFSELRDACTASRSQGEIFVSGCLLLFGFGAKAGMFPLHIWLPKAHPVAPAPASALLSGVLTKAGIFGIILISGSILYGNQAFGFIVLVLGTVTMLLGAVLGVFSIDLKRTFACSSVSQIGFILTGLGMMNLLEENILAVNGAFLHAVNHSLIKLILFLLAGVVYKNLHTLDLTQIKGFGRNKPWFMLLYLAAAFTIGGVPFFSGYVSKTLLHEAIVEGTHFFTGDAHAVLKAIEVLFLVSGGMTVAYMLKIFVVLFVEKPSQKVTQEQGKSYLSLPVKVLLSVPAIAFLIMGSLPNRVMMPMAKCAEDFFYGGSTPKEGHAGEIAFFSFDNLRGAMISIAIGLFVYFVIVRTWMYDKKQGRYVNRIPAWFDLENAVYRPVFVRFIPFLFAVVCRCLDKLVQGIAALVSRTVLAEKRERRNTYVGNWVTDCFGRFLDFWVHILNITVRKKKPIQKSYVQILALDRIEITKTTRVVVRSVSYGLMLSCIGLVLTMIYLLL